MTRGLVLVILAACGGPAPISTPTTPAPISTPTTPVSNEVNVTVLESAPPDALELEVRAYRWACTIVHARDVASDELSVPVGRAIKLRVWTPERPENAKGIEVALVGTTLVKAVVPGPPVDIVFRIDRAGTYEWKCPTLTPPPIPQSSDDVVDQASKDAQNPIKRFQAISAAEYDAFLEANDPTTPEQVIALGKRLYQQKGCRACHSIDGAAGIGPTWKGIWGTSVTGRDDTTRVVDEMFVQDSIMRPNAFVLKGFPAGAMPSFEGQLRQRELVALIAFIKSLK